jgi:hypothetical protein
MRDAPCTCRTAAACTTWPGCWRSPRGRCPASSWWAAGTRRISARSPTQALRAYRERVRTLQAELDADAVGDAARSQRARDELDALTAHLSRVTGLGGRARRVGGAAERARSTATKALRAAVARVAEADPALGAQLEATVRTGHVCSFRPELGPHLSWRVVGQV